MSKVDDRVDTLEKANFSKEINKQMKVKFMEYSKLLCDHVNKANADLIADVESHCELINRHTKELDELKHKGTLQVIEQLRQAKQLHDLESLKDGGYSTPSAAASSKSKPRPQEKMQPEWSMEI